VGSDYRFDRWRCRQTSWGDLMRVFTAAIAIAAGLLVLMGYLGSFVPALAGIQSELLNWAIIMAGTATLMGAINLVYVHGDKVRRREKGSIYSVLLILSLLATLLLGLVLGPKSAPMNMMVNGIIFPAEAALMALLTVTLIYAAIRLLRRRADLMSIVFLATALLILLGSATLPFGEIPILGTMIRPWVMQVLELGGARGILIGVALGTLTTGLRVLFGADRPYGGQ
jgi:hypothetical protein